jgi:hypothetical protein
MPSSISSSDRRFLRALALWTAGLAVGFNLVVAYGLQHWRWLDRRHDLAKFEAAVNIEDYVLNYRRCPVVVLGSSVVAAVPPPGWERPGVCSVAILGQGALLGLAVMARIPAAPRVLFVEASFGFRDAPPDQVETYADPGLRALHRWFPLSAAKANWINMLGKAQDAVQGALYRPDQPWAAWRTEHQPYSDIYARIYGAPIDAGARRHLDANLAQTRSLIAEMETRGTKVIFFEAPLDPRLAGLPIVSVWHDMMRAAFADHDWVADAPEKYYLTDGMHFTSGSGADFYDLLLSQVPVGVLPAATGSPGQRN